MLKTNTLSNRKCKFDEFLRFNFVYILNPASFIIRMRKKVGCGKKYSRDVRLLSPDAAGHFIFQQQLWPFRAPTRPLSHRWGRLPAMVTPSSRRPSLVFTIIIQMRRYEIFEINNKHIFYIVARTYSILSGCTYNPTS